MKIETVNGFSKLEGQLLFSVSPEDITWRMRDNWLDDIAAGHTVMLDTVIPYLEREAISRFKKEWTVQSQVPDVGDGYEDWRLWWLNEASHNCDTHSPIGRAGDHLTVIGRSAVNILMAASALRDAIHAGRAEESAALGMTLICEALAGGYVLKAESAEGAIEARKEAYKKGAGLEGPDLDKARSGLIKYAKTQWEADPDLRIGELSTNFLVLMEQHRRQHFPTLISLPKIATIKTWIKQAAEQKKLTIPAAAQAPGRRQTPK